MAYTALATKSDGDTLTATHLNAVASNIEFLYGFVQAPNIGFQSIFAVNDDATPAYWTFVHLHQYLHYKVVFVGSTGGDLTIASSVDGSTYSGRLSDGSPSGEISGYLDTTSWGLTVGDPYFIRVTWEKGAADSLSIQYLIESDGTTL